MYGWIGKSCYNHRVILTSTIEYDNFQRLRKFRLSEFFFYVILKLSIVRREKRMKLKVLILDDEFRSNLASNARNRAKIFSKVEIPYDEVK